MQASKDRISYLFRQHLEGILTPSEQEEFYEFINGGEEDNVIKELMNNAWQEYLPSRKAPEAWSKGVFEEVINTNRVQKIYKIHSYHILKTNWFRYAAAIIIIFSAGAYWWLKTPTYIQLSPKISAQSIDIPPGHDGAILTLADGSTVVLDSIANGIIATQKGSPVVLNNGQLTYAPVNDLAGEMIYNTISTTRGRQFQLVLPDGSKVWLNASSSIRFPTAFLDQSRRVEITGEAYFEVTENTYKPFFVKSGNTEVQVLGTSFNINAYPDESKTKTTLLEGSVKVIAHNMSKTLKPGQQSQMSNADLQDGIQVQTADMEKVMAWKNGLFNFNNATLAEVMRQLARWYDINVQYENGIPDIDFEGKVGRDVSFSKMLVFFRESGVDFRMENGNTLVIIKRK